MMARMGIEKGRKTRPKLKIGICGEHGGDAESVKFCHRLAWTIVSASPVPCADRRLAAAQAVVEEKESREEQAQVAKRHLECGNSSTRFCSLSWD